MARSTLFLLLSSLFISCAEPGQSAARKGQEPVLAVIPKATNQVFWDRVAAGTQAAGEDFGAQIAWDGPADESELSAQVALMQQFTAENVPAILLAPLDSRSLVASVRAARKRGIPVIIFDSDLDSDDYESFIATDNLAAGQICGRTMAAGLPERAKVGILRYMEGSASTTAREEGFIQGLAEAPQNLRLVELPVFAGPTIESGRTAALQVLDKYPDLAGIFTANESSSAGMLQALRARGKTSQLRFIGFDANDELLAGVAQGDVHALAVQDPFNMGYLAVETAMKVIQGQPFARRIDTGIKMVTADNLEDAEIQQLFAVPSSQP